MSTQTVVDMESQKFKFRFPKFLQKKSSKSLSKTASSSSISSASPSSSISSETELSNLDNNNIENGKDCGINCDDIQLQHRKSLERMKQSSGSSADLTEECIETAVLAGDQGQCLNEDKVYDGDDMSITSEFLYDDDDFPADIMPNYSKYNKKSPECEEHSSDSGSVKTRKNKRSLASIASSFTSSVISASGSLLSLPAASSRGANSPALRKRRLLYESDTVSMFSDLDWERENALEEDGLGALPSDIDGSFK